MHLVSKRISADGGLVKILVPSRQVLDRSEQTPSPHALTIRNTDLKHALFRVPLIADGLILDHLPKVISKERIMHSEWLEQGFRRELP